MNYSIPRNYLPDNYEANYRSSAQSLGGLIGGGARAYKDHQTKKDFAKELSGLEGGAPIDLEAQRMAVGGTPGIVDSGTAQMGSNTPVSTAPTGAIGGLEEFDYAGYSKLGEKYGDPNLVTRKFKEFQFNQQQQQQQIQLAKDQKFKEALSKVENESDYLTLIESDPDKKAQIEAHRKMRSDIENKTISEMTGPAWSAAMSGANSLSADRLAANAKILTDQGDEAGAKRFSRMSQIMTDGTPEEKKAVRLDLARMFSGAIGVDEFKKLQESLTVVEKDEATVKETEAKTTKALAEAAGLKSSQLLNEAKAKELRGDVLTDRNTILASMKKPMVDYAKVSGLIANLPSQEIGGVVTTNLNKLDAWWNGGTPEVQAWKQQLESYKLVDMLKNKPPGALSEGELKVLQAGVPPEGAGPEVVKAYLEASEKALRHSYAYDKLKVKFLEQNNDQGSAKRDMKIYGETIKKDETFDDFIVRLDKKIFKYGPAKTEAKKKAAAEGKKTADTTAATPEELSEFRTFLGK